MQKIEVLIRHNDNENDLKKTINSINNQTIKIKDIKILKGNKISTLTNLEKKVDQLESDAYTFILESGVELEKTYMEIVLFSMIYNNGEIGFTNFYGNELENTNFSNLKRIKYKNFFNSYCIKNSSIKNNELNLIKNTINLLQYCVEKKLKIIYINDFLYYNVNNSQKYNINLSMQYLIEYPKNDTFDFNTFPKIMETRLPQKKINKKHILFIFPWLVTGGADKFNLDLISKMDKTTFDISIILTRNSIDTWKDLFNEHVLGIYDLSNFLERKDWAGFIDYYINEKNVDLVFFSNSMYGYHLIPWLKAKNPSIPFVDYVHAEDWTWMDGGIPRLSNAICNFVEYTYTCTNHLSKVMMDDMNREKNNLRTAYIGVDEKYYDPDIIDLSKYSKINSFSSRKIILFVCRLVYLKRPFFMVQLIDYLRKKDPSYLLIVVGDGECYNQMKQEVKKRKLENNVFFAGNKRDVRPYYKIAKATIIPSLTEGLALVAYESLSMKTPVISADVGGQKELIDSKVGGIVKKYQNYLTDLYDYSYSKEEILDYANKIDNLIKSKEYENICNECRKRIIKSFTNNKLVEQISNDCLELIKSGSKIEKSQIKDLALYERYLITFNNTFYQSSPIEIYISKKQKLINRLWNFKLYRFAIRILKKIKKVIK